MRNICFFLILLILIVVFECKASENSTTVATPSVTNSTVSTFVASTTSITASPSTTSVSSSSATTPLTTTVSSSQKPTTKPTLPPPSDSSPSNDTTLVSTNNYDYGVCGNVTQATDCTCYKDGHIWCAPSEFTRCLSWYNCGRFSNPPFYTTNIKILNDSFVVKTAEFRDNHFIILKKDKILPGNEKTVEILKLKANRIHHIENGTFDKFTALKELDLGDNYLKNVTAEVFTIELGSSLQILKLMDEAFDSIFALDLSNLIQLKELWLNKNHNSGRNDSFLKYVFPEALGNLTHLDLGSCGITAFGEETFINLRSLKTLLVFGNPLTSFPKAIYVLENLEYLSLVGTNIKVLNNTGSNFTTNLQKLHIAGTSLTFIDDCAFCNFPNLKELFLYQNLNLSYIHENAFGYAYNGTSPPLEQFSLESCNLSMIPEDLLNWQNISKFGLGRNPFFCNCSMAWLINDLLSPTHSVNLGSIAPKPYRYSWESPFMEYKCYGPYALQELSFTHISRNFCPNEATKKKKSELKEEKNVAVTESPSPFYISWFHICVGIALIILAFTFGIFVIPLFRFINRPKKVIKGGFCNQNFPDSTEDFDDGKV